MTITPKTIVLALAASAVLLFGFSFLFSPSPTSSPSSPSLPSFAPQESEAPYRPVQGEAGNVTVIITPKDLSPGQPPVFDVVFDTHSVNLDFDVAAAAALTDDQGTTYGTPAWSGDPPGGHHRSGTLTFPTPLGKASTVSLIFKDIAGVPMRTFEWKVY